MRPLTKAAFARERRVSRTRVYQWLKAGRIAALEDGRIDADDAHARLDANLDQAKGIRGGGNITSSAPEASAILRASELPLERGADESNVEGRDRQNEPENGARGEMPSGKLGNRDESGYWEHKARREKAEAQLAEMKALQAAGALIPAAAAMKEMREAGRATRNRLLAMVDRVAPVLDPASPARAHKLLSDEVQKVIRELCDRLDARAAGPAPAREPEGVV